MAVPRGADLGAEQRCSGGTRRQRRRHCPGTGRNSFRLRPGIGAKTRGVRKLWPAEESALEELGGARDVQLNLAVEAPFFPPSFCPGCETRQTVTPWSRLADAPGGTLRLSFFLGSASQRQAAVTRECDRWSWGQVDVQVGKTRSRLPSV